MTKEQRAMELRRIILDAWCKNSVNLKTKDSGVYVGMHKTKSIKNDSKEVE